jgi:hypothetical protein
MKDRERRKLPLFPLGGKKMDEYPRVRSLLVSVATVFGKGERRDKGVVKEKDGMNKNLKANNEKLPKKECSLLHTPRSCNK